MSTPMAWYGNPMARFGEPAGAVTCCCDEGCACCASINDVIFTVDAPGCGFDGATEQVVAQDSDLWSWIPPSQPITDCGSQLDLDYLELIVSCVDGQYQLLFSFGLTVPPYEYKCYATSCTQLSGCNTAEGFEFDFTVECEYCCGGTPFIVNIKEVPNWGP